MGREGQVPAGRAARVLFIAALLACCSAASAADLKDFTSDGCSLFPDGTLKDRAKWCDCCLRHDISYWRGGSEEERQAADTALRDCVLASTGDKILSETMYLGVRAGGHPVFPAWYRWAYGWSYGRGYQPLNVRELEQVRGKLDVYWKSHPAGYCAEKHRTEKRGDKQ